MKELRGKVISGGIAIGTIRYYEEEQLNITRTKIETSDREIQRFNDARIKAKEQLKEIYKLAVASVGRDLAEIFEVQQLILLDEEYVNKIKSMISDECVNAEYAVYSISKQYEKMLSESDNSYISDRAVDINDVSERVIRLLDAGGFVRDKIKDSIVIINEANPSDMINLSEASGLVTLISSYNSHSAIMSRNMGLPHITGIDLTKDMAGKMAIIDGDKGVVYIEPDEAVLEYYAGLKEDKQEIIKGVVRTISGVPIEVMSNVNSYAEAKKAMENHCDGIGLFRTEFIYMNRDKLPEEDEQFKIYKDVLELYKDKPVIIRTLDAGADKRIEYLDFPNEKNPSLGCRGIRYSLMKKDVLKTQLRAVYRASVYGNVKMMFPMITSLDEIRQIKAIIGDVKRELNKENVEYKDVSLGVMIETPAAAMISDILAKEVEFFSIGTNDLAQYSLAVDRENTGVAEFYNPCHEGIMRLIKLTVSNAHKENCRVGICGEMASDTRMAKQLIELGIDSLSVSPVKIQELKMYIQSKQY